jgi:hypothetical protein
MLGATNVIHVDAAAAQGDRDGEPSQFQIGWDPFLLWTCITISLVTARRGTPRSLLNFV